MKMMDVKLCHFGDRMGVHHLVYKDKYMRIWHEKLIPFLCSKHLTAMWNESWIAFNGIKENKNGWRTHPARKEFEQCPDRLWDRLQLVKKEADKRGFNFIKPFPQRPRRTNNKPKEWQTLNEQINVLVEKRELIESCNCDIENIIKLKT